MKALTKKQQEALVKIKVSLERSGNTRYHAYNYFKDSWRQNGCHEGIPRTILEGLEKKGYIKLDINSCQHTGVYNSVAQSWGYSTYIVSITAELV